MHVLNKVSFCDISLRSGYVFKLIVLLSGANCSVIIKTFYQRVTIMQSTLIFPFDIITSIKNWVISDERCSLFPV